MAGASLKVKFIDQEVTDFFQDLLAKGENPGPVLREIGEFGVEAIESHFANQRAPDGSPWKPLDKKYQKRKKKNKDKILVLNEHLGTTIAYKVNGTSVAIGSNRVYAATHQFGDDKRGIPAREFLGFSKSQTTEIIEITKDFLIS